jgi:hypothetical protein
VDEAIREYLSANVSSEYVSGSVGGGPAVTITRATAEWSESDGILLTVSFISDFELRPPVLGFVIYDAVGTPVYGTNSRFDSQENIPRAMRSGTIRVMVSTESLRPDTYYISLWLGDHYQDYCHIDRALRVEVGTGAQEAWRPPREWIGSVRLKTTWYYSS